MKHKLSSIDRLAGVVSWGITRRIALRSNWIDGQVAVVEFPKSGGTWLSKMLGNYLDLPVPQHSRLPVAMPAVLHSHWLGIEDPAVPVVYVVRDPRDVMVSLFHHHRRLFGSGLVSKSGSRTFRRYEDSGAGSDDLVAAFSGFVNAEMTKEKSTNNFTWGEHVRSWHKRSAVIVRYEDLLADPGHEIERIALALGQDFDPVIGELAVKRNEFEVVAKRKRGSEDRSSFLRSGRSGEFVDYFSEADLAQFERVFADSIDICGY